MIKRSAVCLLTLIVSPLICYFIGSPIAMVVSPQIACLAIVGILLATGFLSCLLAQLLNKLAKITLDDYSEMYIYVLCVAPSLGFGISLTIYDLKAGNPLFANLWQEFCAMLLISFGAQIAFLARYRFQPTTL